MSESYIPAAMRKKVRQRASDCCEYCRLAQADAFFPHEPDHIIAEKHGGETILENLALACLDCNRFKGTDIASRDPKTGRLVALFNPRTQSWSDHFEVSGGVVLPLSAVGRATERVLKLNLPMRVEARSLLAQSGRYPPDSPEWKGHGK